MLTVVVFLLLLNMHILPDTAVLDLWSERDRNINKYACVCQGFDVMFIYKKDKISTILSNLVTAQQTEAYLKTFHPMGSFDLYWKRPQQISWMQSYRRITHLHQVIRTPVMTGYTTRNFISCSFPIMLKSCVKLSLLVCSWFSSLSSLSTVWCKC